MSGHRKFNDLRAKMPPEARERAKEKAARVLRHGLGLGELREQLEVTQVEIARRLKVTQGAVSRLENRPDWQVSSIRDYVAALGGELRMVAVFEGDEVKLAVPAGTEQQIIDLMAALKTSLAQGGRKPKPESKPAGRRVVGRKRIV